MFAVVIYVRCCRVLKNKVFISVGITPAEIQPCRCLCVEAVHDKKPAPAPPQRCKSFLYFSSGEGDASLPSTPLVYKPRHL